MQTTLTHKHEQILWALFPQGILWEHLIACHAIKGFVRVIAREFSKIEELGYQLLKEMDPRDSGDYLIDDWVRLLRIDSQLSIYEKKDAIVGKLSWVGGQSSPQYFAMAKLCGIQLSQIERCDPFLVEENTCEDVLYSESWRCNFFLYLENVPYLYANCESDCDAIVEAPASIQALTKELLRKVPVFSQVHFVYQDSLNNNNRKEKYEAHSS